MVEQLVKLPNAVSQDRIQERTVERMADIPVPQVVEELVEVFNSRIVAKIDEVCKTTRAAFEGAISQFIDKVVDISVVAQRRIHMNRNVHETMEIRQLQHTDQVVDVPIVLVAQVPRVQVVEEAIEIPQLQVVKKIGVIPETVEISKLPLVEKNLCNHKHPDGPGHSDI